MASPQQSGYQCQFVDSVEDYECPLCLHVTREPFLTSCCGQHFCQVCISRIHTDNKPCPFCKENSFTTLLDKKQKRKVLSLKVYCDKKAEGCQWMGSLGELENHLSENCQFVEVNCPNNCGLAFELRLIAKHQTNDCPKRPHCCQYCHLEGTYKEIQDNHLPVCPKYPVPCPNKCGVSPLERDQLEDHLRECPLQLVECELREMGCEEIVKRKDLVRHMEEGAQKHLALMVSKCLETQIGMYGRINKLEQENEVLKKDLAETRSELKKQKTIAIQNGNLNSGLEFIRHHLLISSSHIHINFTALKKTNERWVNDTTIFIFPSKCAMDVNLYFCNEFSRLVMELKHVRSPIDENLKWPKMFTMTVKLVNTTGDHNHHYETEIVEVKRGHYNDQIYIPYFVIENPPQGVQYISDDHITLQILVTEK